MSSTQHVKNLRCSKCGGDGVQVNNHDGKKYSCVCVCGHVYYSSSVAAGAAYARYLRNKPKE